MRAVELWVDGRHVATRPPDLTIPWDTLGVDDGSHDLRLVAVEDSLIETRAVFRTTVEVRNGDRRFHLDEYTADVAYGGPIRLAWLAEGAKQVEVRRGHQVLGTASVENGRWSVTFPSEAVGMGEASVFVRAVYTDGRGVRSEPLALTVREPALVASVAVDGPFGEGLRAVVRGKSGETRELVVAQLAGVLKEIVDGVVVWRTNRLAADQVEALRLWREFEAKALRQHDLDRRC